MELVFAQACLIRSDLDAEAKVLIPVLAKTLAADYRSARKAFDKAESLSPSRRRAFRDLVSSDVLSARQLQWTIHGPQRCFRFWTPGQKKNYTQFAAGVVNDLCDLTPNVCFGFGSALSVVRDANLIPHDDDIDIIIAFEPTQASTLAMANDLVEAHLKARGYTVSGKFMAHRHVAKGNRKSVDVFVGLFEGDAIAWYPGKRGALTREMMFPTSDGVLFGVPIKLPRDPAQYVEQLYGKTWTIPNPEFSHEWDQSPYQDLSS